jgi:hypothetical protein
MANKFASTDLFDFENDYEAYFNRAFNNLIELTLRKLATEENSPVYTGYFASSWKASKRQIQRESRKVSDRNRRTKQPWSTVYKTRTRGTGDTLTEWGVKKNLGVIEPRFPQAPEFNFKKDKTVFIGNQANYAPYALEDGKTIAFIQGEMKKLIDDTFREKPVLGRIRVGAEPAVNKLSGRYGVSYEPLLEP